MNCNPLVFSACQHPQQLLIFGPTGRQVEVDLVLLTSKSHDPASYCRSLSIVDGFFNANGPQSKKISEVHLWFFFFFGAPSSWVLWSSTAAAGLLNLGAAAAGLWSTPRPFLGAMLLPCYRRRLRPWSSCLALFTCPLFALSVHLGWEL